MSNCKEAYQPGQRVGRFTVIGRDPDCPARPVYVCRCDCGHVTSIWGEALPKLKTCGCGIRPPPKEKPQTESRHAKRAKLIGEKHGKLTILSDVGRIGTSRRLYFLCLCECGEQTTANISDMRSGRKKSCGCLSRGSPDGAARNKVLYGYKTKASDRKIEFSISDDEFFALIVQNCSYCKRPPHRVAAQGKSRFTCNGVDRVDNRLGYVAGNVVPCCGRCNHAKGALTRDEFIAMCHQIAAENPNSDILSEVLPSLT